MKTIKFGFFSLSIVVLLGAYHARPLHDVYKSFDQNPPFQSAKIIRMVTEEEEHQSPPSHPPSLVQDHQTTYDQVKPKAPPPPKEAPSQGQTTYGRQDNKKAPPPSKVAITDIVDLLVKDSSSEEKSSRAETKNGRDDPATPSSPDPNDSQGHSMYG